MCGNIWMLDKREIIKAFIQHLYTKYKRIN